jgi:hypothetical protein
VLSLLSAPPDCATCGNRRHVRTAHGWARCSCTRAVTSLQYIKPSIRSTDLAYPVALDAVPPLPLTTSLHAGNWDTFRTMVWRSLMSYEPDGLSYDVLTLSRLIDIDFSREDGALNGYSSLAYLEDIHLLILLITTSTPCHRWTGHVLAHVMDLRKLSGKPVWVFTSLTGNRLWELLRQSEDGVIETLRDTFAPANIRHWK